MATENKSLFSLIIEVLTTFFKWLVNKKEIEKENEELKEQIKITELNKINDNLATQYNKIDEEKDKVVNENQSITDIQDALNDKFK